MIELLAPAGNRSKLNTAFHFGADAVYVGGMEYSLRAYADNFNYDTLSLAVVYAHSLNKKVYVAINIFPKDSDYGKIEEFIQYLEIIKVDGIIISDLGLVSLASRYSIPIHISTQANTTNGHTARVYQDMGVSRIVLAREVSIDEIKTIRDMVSLELEVFVHGAMCVSYSGRCLLSNYLSDRDSNRGECVQACRWEYLIREKSRGNELTITEDDRGTYIMNSRDLNMINHLDKFVDAGVNSFKIEGRMKSQYYVGNVVNAYRRVIDNNYISSEELQAELIKNSHRGYTTGFYLGEYDRQDRSSSQSEGSYDFVAEVIGNNDKGIIIEQRNRFNKGEKLEILSNNDSFNKSIIIDRMYDTCGNIIDDAKLVQQKLVIETEYKLNKYDILRKQL